MIYGIVLGLTMIVGSLIGAFWWGVMVGLIIDLALFLWPKYGVATKTWWAKGKGAVSSTSASSSKPEKSAGWLWTIGILALIAWCGYSLDQRVGFPGSWIAGKGYSKTFDLVLENLQDQKLCGVKSGVRTFSFPYEDDRLKRCLATNGQVCNQTYHYIKSGPDDKNPSRYDMADMVRVNGAVKGDEIEVPSDGCVTISIHSPKAWKDKAIIIGREPGTPQQLVGLMIKFQ